MNVDGTAILKPGQYRGAYKIGLHRGYDALVQRKAVTVYRDKNRDETLDMAPSTAQEGMYGINIHKSGRKKSTQVNRFSAGCQVFAEEAHFDELMSIVYCAKTKWGDSFTYTLVDQPDF